MAQSNEAETRKSAKTMTDSEEDDDSKIFPQRLMEVLSNESNSDAICWMPHGRAFIIRDRDAFAEKVMPRFFPRKAKYSSFTRKLNRWNFVRVSSGPEIGSWYHEFFIQSKPHLAAQMFCKNARAKLAMASDLPAPQTVAAVVNRERVASEKQQLPTVVPDSLSLPRMASGPVQQQPALGLVSASVGGKADGDFGKSELLSMAYGTTNMVLLERQIQLLQQKQAQRLMVERLLGNSMQQQHLQPSQVELQAARLLQMRQLMSMGHRQRQASSPRNGRASAA